MGQVSRLRKPFPWLRRSPDYSEVRRNFPCLSWDRWGVRSALWLFQYFRINKLAI
jgi:hypothetical protein